MAGSNSNGKITDNKNGNGSDDGYTGSGIAILYDRASTRKQDENFTRQDVQRIGKEIATRYGYDVEDEPRYEQKSGESLDNRTVMKGIINDIESHRLINGKLIKAIIVASFSRLSRDEDVVDGLVIRQTCKENDVVVIDFNGKIYDFSKENDQDTALLEFWFAARDKRQLVSNMIRGQKEKALLGRFMGGSAALGYQMVFSGEINRRGTALRKLVIDQEEAELIREVFRLYTDYGAAQVSAILNQRGQFKPIKNEKALKSNRIRDADKVDKKKITRPFRTPDVLRIISNPLYAGWVKWGFGGKRGPKSERSKYLKDFEPQMHFVPELQIVSQDVFDRAQRIRQERFGMPGRAAASHYPFGYLLKCRCCGSAMAGKPYNSKNPAIAQCRRHAYSCQLHYNSPLQCIGGQQITAYPVATALIPFVAQLINDKTRLMHALAVEANELAGDEALKKVEEETRRELEKTSTGLQRLMDLITDGTITRDEAKQKIQELRDKKERLTMKLQSFQERAKVGKELTDAIELLKDDLEGVLWKMFEEQIPSLRRIMRLVFKPHSVVVEGYYDRSVPYKQDRLNRRKGRLVAYELQDWCKDLAPDSASGPKELTELAKLAVTSDTVASDDERGVVVQAGIRARRRWNWGPDKDAA